MPYDIDIYTDRARSLLADGPKSREHLLTHGMPQASIKMLQRNGVIRPKMQPWVNSEGRVIGAVERWQMAPAPTFRTEPKVERLDCALIDFAELGIG
jgi:hypothetical protein